MTVLHIGPFQCRNREMLPLQWFNHQILGTSSTAQGGGGSFKNRKSIGEIACCESWMSEQKH